MLDRENIVPVKCYVTIVAADLRIVDNIAVLKGIFLKYRNVPRRIFLMDHRARLFPAQAYALGATHVLFNPLAQRDLLKVMAEAGEAPLECAQPVSRATPSVGAVALASMFSAVLTGQSINVEDAKQAASKLADAIAEEGLSGWLDTVRSTEADIPMPLVETT